MKHNTILLMIFVPILLYQIYHTLRYWKEGMDNNLKDFCGEWDINYTNGFKTKYIITKDGKVKGTNPVLPNDGERTMRLLDPELGPSWLCPGHPCYYLKGVHSKGKFEYLTLKNGELHIRHYNPNFCCTGIGKRIGECGMDKKSDYKIVKSGECPEGYEYIMDEAGCLAAGKDYQESKGFRFDQPAGGYKDSGSGRTKGCTIHNWELKKGGATQFFPKAKGKCGTASFNCLCKR